jgi:hypothetical protein
MEMQLENKVYTVVDNIFSDKVLAILKPYAKLLPSDKSSYDVWAAESTNNNTAPECFTCDVLGKDRLAVIDELYNNSDLPCYQKKWLKDCDIAIQKLPVGGFIPKHTDHCIFSLTVFLSEVKGGEFYWWGQTNEKHIVQSSYNKGIFSYQDTFTRGFPHEVETVEQGVRFTLQLFVFDKKKQSNETQGVVWEINQ